MIYDIVLSKYLTEFSLAFSIEYIERVYNVYKKNITPYVFCVVIFFTNIFFSVLSKSNDYGRTIRAGDLGLGKAKKKTFARANANCLHKTPDYLAIIFKMETK